ncbi:DNA cytosine methyltransferase [Polaromonas sp. P5_E6]
MTPHEAARIQGFPDYFSFDSATSATELRQMIGNAVAPALSFALITKLLG